MMYPHHYGSQLVHSPATPGSMPLFSSTPLTSAVASSSGSTGGISVPTPIRPCKRSISDDSTDDEMDHKSLHLADSNMDGNCHLMSRKKRRGLIEKRRRDRINNSLHELKRLVPAAFEKQGSAKLEKAEILQLTVDHLRMLHSKGFDAFSFDPHKFATDYHLIGFREAATEVARYLAVHEGIDFQDPLRLRLMTHLHTYSSQRELSLKSCTGWNPSLFTTPMYPPLATATATATSASVPSSTPSATNNSLQSSSHNSTAGTNCGDSMHNSANSSSHHNSYSSTNYSNYSLDNSMMAGSSSGSSSMACTSSSLQPSSSSKSPSAFSLGYSSVVPSTPMSTIPSSHATTSSYSYPYAAGSYFAPTASYMPPMIAPTSNNLAPNSSNQSSVKHYRPWGTELAY